MRDLMFGKKICLMILTIMIILYTKGRVLASNAKEEMAVPAPQLFAQSAALIDGETGRVLFGKQEDTVLPMASTTKIMTCILALENASLNDVVNVSDYAASMPDVQLHIR